VFIPGGIFILLALIFLTIIGVLIFSRRRLAWFGRLPGDIRYEGRRTRVYAPLASVLCCLWS
jgi:hypothetical protein